MRLSELEPDFPFGGTRSTRVLIVEDERIVAMGLRRQLTALGYDVVGQVATGEEAVRVAGELHPDLVLMDVRLEGVMDGVQAAAEIRERFHLPVVYLSAFSNRDILDRAKVTEPCGYILKPYEDRELQVVIEMALYKHQMERERRALREVEQRAQQERLASLATLAAGMAHEINNPVGMILLSAEIGTASPERAPEMLSAIADNARRCGQIVRNVLRFANQETLAKEAADVNEVVRRACLQSADFLASRGCRIVEQLAEKPLRAAINEAAIEQLLLNLLQNSAQASVDVPDRVIEVHTERTDGQVRIIVRDQGQGMDAETLRHAREPFYTTRRHEGGVGLGLSLAQGIIRDHGGSLDIRSVAGQGTTVVVTLPSVR